MRTVRGVGWRCLALGGPCFRLAPARQRCARSFADEERGQSSVEYALVLLAFLSMVLALGAVWKVAQEGGLQRLASRAASHALGGEGTFGGMRDIVLF